MQVCDLAVNVPEQKAKFHQKKTGQFAKKI